jgi:hypothetical protein
MPETTLLNSVHPIEIKRDTGVVYDISASRDEEWFTLRVGWPPH